MRDLTPQREPRTRRRAERHPLLEGIIPCALRPSPFTCECAATRTFFVVDATAVLTGAITGGGGAPAGGGGGGAPAVGGGAAAGGGGAPAGAGTGAPAGGPPAAAAGGAAEDMATAQPPYHSPVHVREQKRVVVLSGRWRRQPAESRGVTAWLVQDQKQCSGSSTNYPPSPPAAPD